jgi:hypothetical protein
LFFPKNLIPWWDSNLGLLSLRRGCDVHCATPPGRECYILLSSVILPERIITMLSILKLFSLSFNKRHLRCTRYLPKAFTAYICVCICTYILVVIFLIERTCATSVRRHVNSAYRIEQPSILILKRLAFETLFCIRGNFGNGSFNVRISTSPLGKCA